MNSGFIPASADGEGNEFAYPFWIFIPGPNNPSYTGVTLDEVERVRKDLLHGFVPSNWNHPGVAVTPEIVSAAGYQVNGYLSAREPGGLDEQRRSERKCAGVELDDEQVGPGTLPGAVNSINGNSGAFTFTGAGVSCAGTTCTVAGSSGSGTVQAGNQYSPAFYNQTEATRRWAE